VRIPGNASECQSQAEKLIMPAPESHKSNAVTKVGYKSPPVHSRFKPGVSGNPSGRRKGSKNLKTLFNDLLGEEISVREGTSAKKMTRAEALARGLVVGALRGDSQSLALLLRVVEQAGGFEHEQPETKGPQIILLRGVRRPSDENQGGS
jgi:hypothetical protein